MTLDELILPESVLCNAKARSKKHCLEILSELLSSTAPDIPHCRVDGLKNSSGALLRLSTPIDFDTADGEVVDLVLGLMVPEAMNESHYADVRLVTEVLADDQLRQRLRESTSSSELYRNLVGDSAASAAGQRNGAPGPAADG